MTSTRIRLLNIAAAAMVFAGAFGSGKAEAAHLCTLAEVNQYSALLDASIASGKTCYGALSKKYSAAGVKRACSICAADYRAARRLENWIAKHRKCAGDLHASQLVRAEREWIGAYKKLCQ